MQLLTLSEVSELKTIIKKQFGMELHFHDCCGGQSFSVEQKNEELTEFIFSFFKERNLSVSFSEDGMQFVVKEMS